MSNILIKSLNNDVIQKSLLEYKSNLPRIVYYHLVSDNSKIPYYYKKNLFNEKLLDEQLSWYIRRGYKFITLDEAVYLVQNDERATKTIAFTTDDGFKENYFTIAPIFQKYGIKATLFLISNCLNNNDLNWDNKIFLIKNSISVRREFEICTQISKEYNLSTDIKDISLLREYWPMAIKDDIANYAWTLAGLQPLDEYLEENKLYMTNVQIKELLKEGYTIGSHSVSHSNFSKLSEIEIISEMINSKKILKNTFGIEPHYFAYPYGKRPSKLLEQKIIQKGIYKLLFGTKSNLTNNKLNKIWERDKMEQDKEMSQFWFTVVPVLRNIVLNPLGIYK